MARLVTVSPMTCSAAPPGGRRHPLPSSYDTAALADSPAFYLLLGGSGTEASLTGALTATYHNAPGITYLPNGDPASVFDGTSQYVDVPDDDSLSVSATGQLTVEAWMRPDTVTFPSTEGTGYVNWLGKITYGTTNQSEWIARMYSQGNTENRANRISGYAFNAGGGLGAGSYFQDPVRPGEWIHYALVINTSNTSSTYPTGYVKIYKNGVLRDQDALADYNITPSNTTSPMRIGTASLKSYFKGSIGKVAVYDTELPAVRLATHYQAMVK
ncbi:LamG domain-containing protein [Streptomyces sp. NPDC052107]|uniref:LamG domain-containing protein n=1 Tax=Streptomyces sp. NPDC052107 TaxID=3155632 RepID=UPI00343B2897